MSIATELTALSGHITNAYDAVNTKGGTIPANKNMANLDDAILSIPSGGQITNGTVAQYKATSSTILKDTFVEFVDTQGEPELVSELTTPFDLRDADGAVVSVRTYRTSFRLLPLGNNRGVIAYLGYPSGDSSTKYLYIAAFTVSGTDVTTGVSVRLPSFSTTSEYNTYIALDSLDTNKIIVTYCGSSGGAPSGTLAVVCNISGTTITTGTETTIMSSGKASNVVAMSNSKFVASANGTYVVCAVANNTITPGTTESFSNSVGNKILSAAELIRLSDDKLLAYDNYSITTGYAICTVSNMTLKVGPLNTAFPHFYTGNGASQPAVLIDDTTFVSIGYVQNDGKNYAAIGRINGDFISLGGVTELPADYSYTPGDVRMVADGNILYSYFPAGSNLNHMLAGIGSISGETTTFQNRKTQINYSSSIWASSATPVGMLLDDGTVLYAWRKTSDSALVGLILNPVTSSRTITASQTKINGVTIDDITTSTAGDVWTFANDSIYNGDADNRRF